MSWSYNPNDAANKFPVQPRCVRVNWAPSLRLARVAIAWVFALSSLLAGFTAYGQLPFPSTQATTQSQPGDNSSASAASEEDADSRQDSQSSTNDSQSSTNLDNPASGRTLSSDQIINILEQRPDLVMELKSELADRLQQQQGVEIDPNDISDQMLYSEISKSAELRANITTVLRARGYVSDDGLQSLGSGVAGGEALNSQSSMQSSLGGNAKLEGGSLAGGSTTRFGESDSSTSAAQQLRSGRNQGGLLENPRKKEESNSSTDLPKVLHRPTPYDLQSLNDLYAQIPVKTPGLKRFGSDVFINRDGWTLGMGVSSRTIPLDVPLGPDYVVGPGDTLSIDLWGGLTEQITRTIGSDGRILLPEAGSIELAGLTLGKAQSLIEARLKPQYRNAQVAVTVSRLRSVRVYVVGDAQRPGGYDISALGTPLSALYAAGGPTAVGSLRTLLHYRGKQLVEKVDLYDFLLHGIRNGSAPFESGDTLLVPPAGSEIAIYGTVRRPAIYELTAGETTLASVIDDAGGVTAAASFSHIRIERIDANQQRVTITLPDHGGQNVQASRDAINAFRVKDGDRIQVEPILPYSQSAVYLAGHVVRPGRLPYTEGMRLSDVLRSYQDILPEPSERGEIVRLVPPDLHAETIDFNVSDVLIGNANFDLRPFDTIRIFGRYQADAPTVTILGEVLRPGKYPMSKGMTAAQLVRMAGGFKRDALRKTADLASYEVKDGNRVVENLATVQIGEARFRIRPESGRSAQARRYFGHPSDHELERHWRVGNDQRPGQVSGKLWIHGR